MLQILESTNANANTFAECFGKTSDWAILTLILKKKKKATYNEREVEAAFEEIKCLALSPKQYISE